MLKINSTKNGYKKVIRYFQVTKNEFKYYNSIFSSAVWNDKPLFRTDLNNLENISIIDDDVKIKFGNIKFSIRLQIKNSEIKENLAYLDLGWEELESDIGISLLKILMLVNKIKNNK